MVIAGNDKFSKISKREKVVEDAFFLIVESCARAFCLSMLGDSGLCVVVKLRKSSLQDFAVKASLSSSSIHAVSELCVVNSQG